LNQLEEGLPETTPQPRCRIGVAQDEAFHFYYEDNLSRLKALGAELIPFSPIHELDLPEIDGIYLGGGYPELHAEALSKNEEMREAVREFAAGGGVVYAECGGLMYLCSGIRTDSNTFYPMAGVFPAETIMSDRLQAIGYVEVETTGRSFLGGPGQQFRGHQFRYSCLEPEPSSTERVYVVRAPVGDGEVAEGYQMKNVVASYVHAHWASNPGIAENFVSACAG
jgi:cobyrinic acid a,c-diamide synthase